MRHHQGGEVRKADEVRRAAESSRSYYRVREGDTLYSIAWRYDLDYHRLAAWNRIRPPYRIYPGQRLYLKAQPSVAARPYPVHPKPLPPKSSSKPVASKPTPVTQKPAVATTKPAPEQTRRLGWAWPTRGAVVKKYLKTDRTRQGIRIAGRAGQPVVAAESGKVVYSGSGLVGYGKLIIIKHDKNYLSAYGFNRKLLVREGEEVTRGAHVAEMGQSAEGKAMLHFEIRRKGTAVDPLRLLPPR